MSEKAKISNVSGMEIGANFSQEHLGNTFGMNWHKFDFRGCLVVQVNYLWMGMSHL
jgi:hypothetical protein